MNALRYLIALPKRHGADVGPIRCVDRAGMVSTKAPAIWCSDPQQLMWSRERQTVIVGKVFHRTSSAPIIDIADETSGQSLLPVEKLIDNYWGSYLAVGAGRDLYEVLRDPTGFMPCYAVRCEKATFLASDITTLKMGRVRTMNVDWDRLFEFLTDPGNRRTATCLTDIRELAPGALASFRDGRITERTMWSPWNFTHPDCRTPSETAADAVRDTVCASVAALASNFQNIVVALSGGLDSSIVSAALASGGRRFSALTMYTDDRSGDERTYARLVAERTGAELLEHRYDAERIDLAQSVSSHLPRPIGRTFMQEIERAFREQITANGFDAIFTGNGGDNVFCYLHSAKPIVDRLRTAGQRSGLASTFRDMCRITQCDAATMARATIALLSRRGARSTPGDMDLLNPDRVGVAQSPALTPYLEDPGGLPGKRAHIDMLVRIQNHVEGYDRHTMPPALPVLLSQPVVETCLRIASWDWCRGGINRAVAREAFNPALPDAITNRRSKSGPESLTAAVFQLGRRELREMLLGGLLRDNRIIDIAALEAAFDDPAVTRGPLLFRILELAEAEAWARSWTVCGRDGA